MDRRTATSEDLPPLQLRELRRLRLDEPSEEGRPAHVAAASGVVRRGDFAYVIGDDELFLAVFRLSAAEEPGTLRRALAGDLPLDHDARGDAKPDLEALTVLPPFAGHPYGALLGLGSGSGTGGIAASCGRWRATARSTAPRAPSTSRRCTSGSPSTSPSSTSRAPR